MPAVTVNDLNNAKLDCDTIGAAATSSAPTVTDRLGNTKNTLSGMNAAVLASAAAVQGSIGYLPPVAYAAGISLTLAAQTVGYSGQTYAPILSALPFTTSGTFENAKFRLIQGVSGADLAAPGGAGIVGYSPPGVGAVATTAALKLLKLVDLSDYSVAGAVDDTAAFQNAINRANLIGGAVIRCDPGKLYIANGLLPKSNVLIDLNGSTLKLKNAANVPIFFDQGAGNGTRFGVINGTLDCNQANNADINVIGGVWLTNWTNLKFNDLTIINCSRSGLNLIGVRHVQIKNYVFKNSGQAGAYFAYALSLEADGATRSRFVEIDGVEVSNVIGFGIHFYRCDDFTAKNLSFSNLNYSNLSISITCTETNRGELANISCSSVSGDNIEVNDSSHITIDNIDVTNAGNKPLVVGSNTPGNYNRRIKISRFKSTGTGGAAAAVLSACIDSDFERLDMDKGVFTDNTLALTSGNTVRDSSFATNAVNAAALVGFGFFTLERVKFLDYTYRYLGKQTAVVSRNLTIPNAVSYTVNLPDMLPTVFVVEAAVSGGLRVWNSFAGSPNQGSLQKCDFVVNDFGTAANLSAITVVNNAIARALTITGDAAGKQLVLTNASGVDLSVSIEVDVMLAR